MIEFIEDYLPLNEMTRSGIKLERRTGVCIHYAGSPGATYQQLRSFFVNLKHRYASYHWVIDQQGIIYKIIPEDECAWHGGPTDKTKPAVLTRIGGRPNWSTESICYLHNDAAGTPTKATVSSLIRLTAWRLGTMGKRNLDRHYDYTHKDCPRYYVHNNSEWVSFKQDVQDFQDALESMRGLS